MMYVIVYTKERKQINEEMENGIMVLGVIVRHRAMNEWDATSGGKP